MANGVKIRGRDNIQRHDRDRLVRNGLSCLDGGGRWGGGYQPISVEGGAAALGPEIGALPHVPGVGEELLPDSGYGLDGEVPKDKKGGLLPLRPLVADLILPIKEST